jgi:peptide/nickel transport system permease protein
MGAMDSSAGVTIIGSVKPRTRFELLWRQLRKNKLALLGASFLIFISLLAIFAHWLGLQSITEMDLQHIASPPSWKHLLGTDSYGRDMLARLVYGARVSLTVGILAVGGAMAIGVPLGLLSGYVKGRLDNFLMRIMDAIFSFPPILLAIALVAILGPSMKTVIIALAIVYTPRFARVVRASALSERELDYIVAARAMGCSFTRIIFLHIFPNIIGPLTVQATVTYAYAILTEASLSFLGLGVQPPTPSWGLMLSDARMYLEEAPYYPIFPGIAIVLSVLSVNLFGDGLRDAMDPKQQGIE